MDNLKILIVEGNLKEENQNFKKVGIPTHTESLKESLNFLSKDLSLEVVNPSSDKNIDLVINKLENYDGLIWGGSSLNIYNISNEIKNQIDFMKECLKKVKNILAICWGMQVAVTAAGGEVKKAEESQIGIAEEIEINETGSSSPLYIKKERKFNSPAFNFDEVVTLPKDALCLSSNLKNKIQSLYFKTNNTNVWGLQYHPEISYEKMVNLIEFRKEKLIKKRKVFKDEYDMQKQINLINNEILNSNKNQRMLELENWINIIRT